MAIPIEGAEGYGMDLGLQVELEGGVPGGVWGLCLWGGGVPGVWGWAGVLFVPSPSVTMTMTTDPGTYWAL